MIAVLTALVAASVTMWLSWRGGSHVDTEVYRQAAHAVLRGASPYSLTTVVPFVYPPPAVLITLLAAIGGSVGVASAVWALASLACLARVMRLLVGAAWPELPRGQSWQRTCWLFAAACLMEPTVVVLSFGQVGLILLWLTVEGLHRQPTGARGTVLVGVAAAIKLTPGIVLLGLAAAGRWRSVLWGILGFVAAWVVATALAPATTRDYLTSAWRRASDVNAGADALNHSLVGAGRLVGTPTWVGLVLAVAVLAFGIALTALAWRRGDELAGLATILVTGLLASPVSWGHHWVAVYPALVLLLREGSARRWGVIALVTTATAGMLLWVDEVGLPASRLLPAGQWWLAVPWEWTIAWGLAFLGWVAVALLRRPVEHRVPS